MKSWLWFALACVVAGGDGEAAAAAMDHSRSVLLSAHAESGQALSAMGAATVLYDQIPPNAVYALPIAHFSDPASATLVHDGADDFDVVDPAGWTVTGFDFILYGNEESVAPAELFIYPAAIDGRPGSAPVCSVRNASAVWDFSDPDSVARIDLPTPCLLPPGKYWVSPAGVERNFYWLAYDDAEPRGLSAVWRSPAGGYGDECRDWADVYKCWGTANTDVKFNFRVLGQVGQAPTGLDLAVTLSAFNPDAPDACGSSTELIVTVGDQVTVCYTATNRSGADLYYHTLSDNVAGRLFSDRELALGLGQSTSFQRVLAVGLESTIVATWTGRNARASYVVDEPSGIDFIDLSSGGAVELPPSEYPMGDDGAVRVPVPFAFSFFGQAATALCIGNNGYLMVGDPAEAAPFCMPGGLWANGALPDTQLPGQAILPAWMDLYLDGTTYYRTVGEPGERQFIVEWFQRNRWATVAAPGKVTFEVILDEASGAITFVYDQMAFEDSQSPSGDYGQMATVGLQNSSSEALQYSFAQPLLTNGKAIRWTPTTPISAEGSGGAHLDIGAPQVVVAPAALNVTIAAGESSAQTIVLGNTGNRELQWSIDRAWPTLHFPPAASARYQPAVAERVGVDYPRATSNPPMTAEQAAKSEQKRAASATQRQRSNPTAGVVPAYGIYAESDGDNVVRYLVALDADSPDTYERIAVSPSGPLGPYPFNYALDASGAAFVDNDFSRLYVIGLSGSFGYFDLAHEGALELIRIRMDDPDGNQTAWCTYDPPQPCWYGLTADPVDGVLYAMGIVYDYDFAPVSSQLFSIDAETGRPTPIGVPVMGVEARDIAIDPQGLMYGIDPTSDVLLAIDKTTGEMALIGSIGFDAYGGGGGLDQSLSFDPSTGTLWYAAQRYVSQFEMHGEMYTVDTLTGAASFHAPLYQEAALNVFEIAMRSGPCSRPASVPWLNLTSTPSGSTQPGASSNVAISLSTEGLAAGVYQADVCVFSNDPTRRNHPISVPVSLTVAPVSEPSLFKSGFEAAMP